MKEFYLRDWDFFCITYRLNNGNSYWVMRVKETQGFLKRFIFFRSLAVVNENGWVVYIGKRRVDISDIYSVTGGWFFFFNWLCLEEEGGSSKFYYFTPLEWLVSVLDPTYDSLDREENFGVWLKWLVGKYGRAGA